VRVLIAEDQLLLRDGLTRMLTAYGLDVVAAIDDGSHLAETLVSVALFAKLGLPPSSSDHRRVLAVLAYLDQ
jgi:hypothetical protein